MKKEKCVKEDWEEGGNTWIVVPRLGIKERHNHRNAPNPRSNPRNRPRLSRTAEATLENSSIPDKMR